MRFFERVIPVTATENRKPNTSSILSVNLGTKIQLGAIQTAYVDEIYASLQAFTKQNLTLGHAPNSSLSQKFSYVHNFKRSYENMRTDHFIQRIPEMLLSKPENPNWRNYLSDDFVFMIGAVTATESSSFIGVDLTTYHCLNKLMGDNDYKIKSGSTTFENWARFLQNFRSYVKISQDRVIVPVTISMNKKSIRGEFVIKSLNTIPGIPLTVFDSNVYPASFTLRKRGFREFENVDLFVRAVNAILEDFHRRQVMAKDYLSVNPSPLMSRETFGQVFDALQPYIVDGEDNPTWEFDKLMGGRNPVRSVIGVEFQNSARLSLQIPVERCSWCNFPITVAFTQQSQKRVNAPSEKIRAAAALATNILREEHKALECRGKRNPAATHP